MKLHQRLNLITSSTVFLLISIIWVINKVPNLEIVNLLLGLIIGNFISNSDHFIYWFWRKPNTEEGKLVKTVLNQKDFKSLFRLIKAAKTSHTSLLFHHYFFQISLNLISFFIFISSRNTIILSILISLNLHLLTDEIRDFSTNSKHLKKWLFAGENNRKIPNKSIKIYITVFSAIFIIFLFFLIKSQI